MLNKVKTAMHITATIYDAELSQKISAALADLGISDIDSSILVETTTDPLITMAVITYCKLHFGTPVDYERLKASYKEQKAQLISAVGYGFPEVVE